MTTKEKIIDAAITVFAKKGKHGARMEEIAELAGINKAMLYYYYSTKENLFNEILVHILRENYNYIKGDLNVIISKDIDQMEKLRQFIHVHYKAFSANNKFSEILIRALASEPEEFKELLGSIFMKIKVNITVVESLFEEGKKAGIFRDVNFRQFMVNVIGMNMIYYIAKPITEILFDMNEKEEEDFINKRAESITDLIFNGINKKE